jgi:hypothetical protein
MDNRKILLVNLSKGRTGELNSQLLGMIFVMKFQAAAMGRANVPEAERVDFTLYVDEFQNFATDSFESILSEARKYKLNLVLANQFMTQLTDKIREAIIGNIGTVISGRIGITDAEILVKKFQPTFDAEDLTRLPNFQTVATVMINNVPSAAFSMSLVPPMGTPNTQLRDALKRLSAAKYGRPRAEVEKEIFARLGAGDAARKAKLEALKQAQQERLAAMQNRPASGALLGAPAGGIAPNIPAASAPGAAPKPGGSSFLDEWLAKRQQIAPKPNSPSTPSPLAKQNPPTVAAPAPTPTPKEAPKSTPVPVVETKLDEPPVPEESPKPITEQHSHKIHKAASEKKVESRDDPKPDTDRFHIRDSHKNSDEGVSVKIR